MAYKYKEPAYYGDMPIAPELVPSMNWRPSGGGGGVTPSGEITEIDFSKVNVKNAPWLKRKALKDILTSLSGDPHTLNQTIDLLNDLIDKMKQCATISAATGA